MARRSTAQLNVRSDKARERVAELVRETGLSAAQVVEDAVRTYRPPPPEPQQPPPEGYVYKGWLLIKQQSKEPITHEELLDAIERGRNRPLFIDNAYLNDY